MYKVVQWYNDEGVPGSALLDIFDIMPGLPITAMEISKKVRVVVTIGSDIIEMLRDLHILFCVRILNREDKHLGRCPFRAHRRREYNFCFWRCV